MEGYGPATYGDQMADAYDAFYATTLDTDAAVEMLAALAGSGPVLELAIGTGRVAVPLAQRGLEVHGIDASERMIEKLRGKPGGEHIPVSMGDFADVAVDGRYSLVFVVFNTFYALLTQADQVRCFENVAAHLGDDGVFVVEAFVPDLGRFDRDQRVNVSRVETKQVMLEASRHDRLEQRIDTQHIVVTDNATRLYPVSLRYVFPSEFDLMGRMAGLELRHRWAGWQQEPFTAQSERHVSIYAHNRSSAR